VVVLASAGVLMLPLYTGMHVSRVKGGLLLIAYAVYLMVSFTAFT
jgi:cation:H+ antiporter